MAAKSSSKKSANSQFKGIGKRTTRDEDKKDVNENSGNGKCFDLCFFKIL